MRPGVRKRVLAAVERHSVQQWPTLPCGWCGGDTALVGQPTWHTFDPRREHPGWEPTWINGTFAAELRCTSPSCGRPSSCVGRFEVDDNERASGHHDQYIEFVQIVLVEPGPRIVTLPDRCPEATRSDVSRAERLILADRRAAAGALRAAVESLLTARGIPSTKLVKRRGGGPQRRQFLSLHERIDDRLRAKTPDVADALLAIKWLGNDGTHDSADFPIGDLLDAFEILESVLETLYDTRPEDIQRKVKAILRRRR